MTTTALNERRYRPDDPGSALAAAARTLRDTFARVPFDPMMPRCLHCVTDADVAALGIEPVLQGRAAVSRFVAKAGTTWGGPDDLRRMVPVILPMLADHALTVDRSLVWAKLRWAGWPAWPDDQVAAVHGFLGAEWDRLLRSAPRPAHAAHRWLAETADAVDDLTPYLDAWHDALGPLEHPAHHEAAVGHLVDLLTNSPLRPDLPATIIDVFPGHPFAAGQVTTWLIGPGTVHELRRAAGVLADAPGGRRITVADERLRRFVAAVGSRST